MILSIIGIGLYDSDKMFNKQELAIQNYIQETSSNAPDLIENESGKYWNVNDRAKRRVWNDIDKGVRIVELISYPNAIHESNCMADAVTAKFIELI